ncbi:MAG: PspC domain-containing protein, partial [Corynebacterium sp.]|nr:PspC domain-containing protein [Corynebacterium sp.]
MWATRPVRFPSSQGGNAKVAGVCEGIAIRYQIDPTLVRLAFVVFGFL